MRILAGRPSQSETRFEDGIYRFIISFKMENDGISPTRREICDYLGISSTSVCDNVLKSLERKGKIQMVGEISRGIRVVGGRWSMVVEEPSESIRNDVR